MAKQDPPENPNASPEIGQSESTKSYREAVDEFLAKRSDFRKRGGNISAVLPQGSPGPPKEDPKPEDSDEV